MTDPPQRVPQLDATNRSEDVRAAFSAMHLHANIDVLADPVLMTLAQHPPLTRPFLDFNRYLLADSTLPVRLRQLAIMRIGWVRRSGVMWASHVRFSLGVGLADTDVEAVKQGSASAHWDDPDRLILTATEQLIADSDIDDETWDGLRGVLGQEQCMELIFTVGTYVLLTMALKTMRVQRSPELLGFAAKYGSPI
jgi:4-carboxymuconolactone decarboxylase